MTGKESMRQKTVLLLGSYGQSNLGDDLLMWNYLELLAERGYQRIYVNANTTEFLPEMVKKTYPDLRIVNTYKTSLIDYLKLIRKVDCVVYGGGTLYKELYSSTGRSPYSVIIRMMGFNIAARLLGTKLYHLHIGTGSLKTRTGRFISKIALSCATMTIFRDQQSYDFAKNILNVNPERIKKSTDGLFVDHVWEKPWKESDFTIDRKKYKRVVGVNFLSDIPDWIDREQYEATIRQFVKTLLDRGDYVVFVPFQTDFNPRNDLVFMKETFADILNKHSGQYHVLEKVPIEMIHSYLKQCDFFVGMRFHSLLLSTVGSVPFVALAYDTKCWRFVEEVGYEFATKLEEIDHDELVSLCDKVDHDKEVVRDHLEEISRKLYKEAGEGLRTLNL
jgi:polysaccharide pyruvyl transferase WcaK-like protein